MVGHFQVNQLKYAWINCWFDVSRLNDADDFAKLLPVSTLEPPEVADLPSALSLQNEPKIQRLQSRRLIPATQNPACKYSDGRLSR